MIDAARQAGVYLGVSYRLHFEPHHRELIRLMKEKTFGPVKALTAEFSWRRGDNKPWLLDKKLAGGGTLFDTGVYPIQAACYTTGESPTHASGVPTTTRDVYPSGIEETMSFTLEFPGGAVAQGRASYCYGAHQLAVCCDQGMISCTAGTDGRLRFRAIRQWQTESQATRLAEKQDLQSRRHTGIGRAARRICRRDSRPATIRLPR